MNLIKMGLAELGLIKLVWLVDHDGERTLAIKRSCLGGDWAYRFWIIDADVWLRKDGVCGERTFPRVSFVVGWVDYK